MRDVMDLFNRYAGGYAYMWVFFMSLVFMFFAFKKDREYWFYPNLVVLLVIFNPIIMHFLTSYLLVGGVLGVFWRTWWIIPIPIIMAIAFTKTLDFVKGKQKAVVAVILCGVIVLSGQFIFNRDNFHRTQNVYQLPNEILLISDIIVEDLGDKDPAENMVVAVYEVAWRLRLYNPDIRMLYGRRPRGETNRQIRDIINNREVDFREMGELDVDPNLVYMIVDNWRVEHLLDGNIDLDDVGVILIDSTSYFSVFKLN